MAQYLRPSSDLNSAWSTTGSSRYSVIGTESYNDSTYITAGSVSTQQCMLSAARRPVTRTNHTMYIRAWANSGTIYIRLNLYQGETLIANYNAGSWGTSASTKSYALSTAECQSITDYSDLRIHLLSEDYYIKRCSWFYLEIPDPLPMGIEMGCVF